jgi:hypothetical protein
MSLYVAFYETASLIGEFKLDRELTIVKSEGDNLNVFAFLDRNIIVLPRHENDYLIGSPHATIKPYRAKSALYKLLHETDLSALQRSFTDEDYEIPEYKKTLHARVDRLNFLSHRFFIQTRRLEYIPLNVEEPFKMKLRENPVIPIGSCFNLSIGNKPTKEDFGPFSI